MAKHVAQIIVGGLQVLGRAFVRAVRNEINVSQQAARARATAGSNSESSAASASTGINLKEAMDILNVKSLDNKELIQKHYDHLFKINDKSNGGSFYIQSKVFRAKERIDAELQAMAQEATSKKNS